MTEKWNVRYAWLKIEWTKKKKKNNKIKYRSLTVQPYLSAMPCNVSVLANSCRINCSWFRTWLQVLPYFFNCLAESRIDCFSLTKRSCSIAMRCSAALTTYYSNNFLYEYLSLSPLYLIYMHANVYMFLAVRLHTQPIWINCIQQSKMNIYLIRIMKKKIREIKQGQ